MASFKILCLWLLKVWLCVSVWVLSSLYFKFFELLGCLYSGLSLNLGKFWSLFLQICTLLLSFSVPSMTSMVYMLVCLMVSHRSLRFYSLFFNLFFFFFAIPQTGNYIVLSSSSLIFYLPTQRHISLVNPTREYFISATALKNSKISSWFLCRFSVS